MYVMFAEALGQGWDAVVRYEAVMNARAAPEAEESQQGLTAAFSGAGPALILAHYRERYRRRQRLACDRKIIDGALCQPAGFERTRDFIDNSADFRTEVLQSRDKVQHFWRGIRLGSRELSVAF